ncbi:RNA-binding S4 domain-containing protein [Rhizobium sp. Leaf341]|uniref:RNA-binding S4 domain-containing protein n=1 Tax=Rhizobium sp. Leaf341 TaxID=1736344 RepID=UPI000713CC26|nr:RNA-binding S4 domain-containing protein [Rhizobium sp. Leaf341]KQR79233.1 RNA-binding protein [Rhizobium sp. Leaf341]
MAEPEITPAEAVSRQRLDKWLFFTRLTKSRSIAQKAIEGGKVLVNAHRVTQPSHAVKAGDVVVLSLDRRDITVRMRSGGNRRGPYEEAQKLYDDLTPVPIPGERLTPFEQATREPGSGRPTKRERREIDRLQDGWDSGDEE